MPGYVMGDRYMIKRKNNLSFCNKTIRDETKNLMKDSLNNNAPAQRLPPLEVYVLASEGRVCGAATYYASNSRSSIAFKIFTGGIASNDFTADMCMDETERDGACGDRGLDTSALDEGN